MNVTVLGAGAWGTALARLLVLGGHEVVLWGHDRARMSELERTRSNERYLPNTPLPEGLVFAAELEAALSASEYLVAAVPSSAFREVLVQAARFTGLVVSVTKGIEYDTGLTMCGVVRDVVPGAKPVALSGPTLAAEVARDNPCALVAASADPGAAQQVQQLFHRPTFRVYTSDDPMGVELGGALKNVIAIAAGVADGLGFGDNSKAALVTRAIVEIRRLGMACGAQAETFSGLSGLGDLTVTCFSHLSRNRGLGERLGRGERLPDILHSTVSVAEGYPTSRSAYRLGRKLGISTPIIDEVYAMLFEEKDCRQALRDLIGRECKPEIL